MFAQPKLLRDSIGFPNEKMGTSYFNLRKGGVITKAVFLFFSEHRHIDISSRYLPISSQCSRDTPNIPVSVGES